MEPVGIRERPDRDLKHEETSEGEDGDDNNDDEGAAVGSNAEGRQVSDRKRGFCYVQTHIRRLQRNSSDGCASASMSRRLFAAELIRRAPGGAAACVPRCSSRCVALRCVCCPRLTPLERRVVDALTNAEFRVERGARNETQRRAKPRTLFEPRANRRFEKDLR